MPGWTPNKKTVYLKKNVYKAQQALRNLSKSMVYGNGTLPKKKTFKKKGVVSRTSKYNRARFR